MNCDKKNISLLTMDETQAYNIVKKLLEFLSQAEVTAKIKSA
jgi:hypothetical protein